MCWWLLIKKKSLQIFCKTNPGKIIIDLVRAWKDVDYAGVYEGLSWGNINANTAAQYQKNRERHQRNGNF